MLWKKQKNMQIHKLETGLYIIPYKNVITYKGNLHKSQHLKIYTQLFNSVKAESTEHHGAYICIINIRH